MQWPFRFSGSLVLLLLWAITAAAQEVPQPVQEIQQAGAVAVPRPPVASSGLEAESLPGELTEDISQPADDFRLGPTPVSDVNFMMDYLRLRELFGGSGIRTYGWVEGGYTGSSSGRGILSVKPRQNRFGNEFLLNQIGIAIEKPLRQDEFNIGFMVRYFGGADAALGAAKGGVGYPPPMRISDRTSAIFTSRPTCRFSPRAAWM